jgi:hypothetical protein
VRRNSPHPPLSAQSLPKTDVPLRRQRSGPKAQSRRYKEVRSRISSLGQRADQIDGATVISNDPLNYREPQTPSGEFGAKERIEDFGLRLFRLAHYQLRTPVDREARITAIRERSGTSSPAAQTGIAREC